MPMTQEPTKSSFFLMQRPMEQILLFALGWLYSRAQHFIVTTMLSSRTRTGKDYSA